VLLLLCVARKEEEEEGDGIAFFFFFVPWSLLFRACCSKLRAPESSGASELLRSLHFFHAASSEPRRAPELAELWIGPELAKASFELAASKLRSLLLGACCSKLQAPELAATQAPSSQQASFELRACSKQAPSSELAASKL